MNEEQWKQAIGDFERVWPRVNGAPPPPPPPRPSSPPPPPKRGDREMLAELAAMEARAEGFYRAMASRSSGRAASSLRALASSSARLLRRLRAEAGLRGDDSPPPPPAQPPRSLREALGVAWAEAGKAIRSYREAARRVSDPELRSLLAEAAGIKQRQRQTLRELAKRIYA